MYIVWIGVLVVVVQFVLCGVKGGGDKLEVLKIVRGEFFWCCSARGRRRVDGM